MAGWAVIPTIRIPDMDAALAFYCDTLEFVPASDPPGKDNNSLVRGDARIMLETPAGHFGAAYNAAIEERMGSVSPIALYMEADDLEAFYERLQQAGVTVLDPLADRPWIQREFTVEDPWGTWLTFWRKP